MTPKVIAVIPRDNVDPTRHLCVIASVDLDIPAIKATLRGAVLAIRTGLRKISVFPPKPSTGGRGLTWSPDTPFAREATRQALDLFKRVGGTMPDGFEDVAEEAPEPAKRTARWVCAPPGYHPDCPAPTVADIVAAADRLERSRARSAEAEACDRAGL